ncbi:MAG: hypothetical protein KDK99_21535 [Verrucomicrobiales bacterium]|nr:hypothetical protein [Verrucomicrobiales bacterium]
MNPENSTETLLKSLTPRAAGLELRDRISADLDLDRSWAARVHAAPRWMVASGWAGLGAAAAVSVMGLLNVLSPRPADDGGRMASGGAAVEYPRVLPASEQGPEMRVWSVEHRAWVDPKDGAQMEVQIPQPVSGARMLPVKDGAKP